MKGFASSLDVMQRYRVCLAPLRFGAGLKGKIVDSWAHGTPVCTTPIGAEGMFPATSLSAEGCPDLEVQALCSLTSCSSGCFVQSIANTSIADANHAAKLLSQRAKFYHLLAICQIISGKLDVSCNAS